MKKIVMETLPTTSSMVTLGHDVLDGEAIQEDGIDVIYENEGVDEPHGEDQIQEVFTATSKQMANQKAARGYYDASGKGKGKPSKGGKEDGSDSYSSGSCNQTKGKDSYICGADP